jgi:hypothetical protein
LVADRTIRRVAVIRVGAVVEDAINRLRARRAATGSRHEQLHVLRLFQHEIRMRGERGIALGRTATEEVRTA